MNEVLTERLQLSLDDITLPDSLAAVVWRGRLLRRRRRTRRVFASVAAVTAVAIAVSTLTRSAAPKPLILVAADLPVIPISLAHVAPGVDVSTDFDGGRLRLLYLDRDQSVLGLSVWASQPAVEPGRSRQVEVLGHPATLSEQPDQERAQLVWERQSGQWIRLVGQGDDAGPDRLISYARDLVDVPVGLDMHLAVAPDGWRVAQYKDLGEGGVVTLSDPRDSARSVVVALERSPAPNFDPDTLEYRGSITTPVVQGRPAHLIQAKEGWYLQAKTDGAWFTVQATSDLSEQQVLDIAEGVRL